jgi:hypothetical protein
MKMTPLVLSAADSAPPFTGEVRVKGTAVINGEPVVREARPATITWAVQPGQNIPTITRLDKALLLAVRDQPPYALAVKTDKLTVRHGDKLTVPFQLKRLWPQMKAQVQVQPVNTELPPGLNMPNVNIPANATEAKLVTNVGTNVPPGTYNLVFRSFAQIPFNKDPKAKQKPNVNVVESSAPVQLTILPKQVANLSLDNGNPTVKVGAQQAVTVRVARQFDYAGEFKVELVLPPNVQGVSAEPVTIPPGQNQAKLMLRATTDAGPGPRPNLTVRVVAVVNGNVPITHETKLNVNVVK